MPDHNHIHADMQGHGHGGSTDHPMRHGMVVFGHDTVFMSHLPMFSTADDLRRGLLVTVDDRSNRKTERLQMSDHPAAAATIHDGGSSVSVKIEPITDIYFNDDRDMQA